MYCCRELNVADAAIQCLAAVAGQLGWPQYSALLHQWLRLMGQYNSKPTIRAVCAVLDAFHFKLPEGQLLVAAGTAAAAAAAKGAAAGDAGAPAAAAASNGAAGADGSGDAVAAAAAGAVTAAEQEEEGEAQEEEEPAPSDAEDGEEAEEQQQQQQEEEQPTNRPPTAAAAAAASSVAVQQAVAADMQRVLLRNVLPALHDHLVVEEGGEARAPVAVALVKLLKVRRGGWFDHHFPGSPACKACIAWDDVLSSW